MKILLTLFVLFFSTSISSLVWGSETYDDCILKNMKNIESDLAAKAIIDACEGKHKNSTSSENEDNKTVCVKTDAQNRNGIIYLPNETKPFTGNNLCEYGNGQFKSQGKFKDGRQDGKVTLWYENGQIKLEGNYKDGKLDGKWTEWSENSQLQAEEYWKDNKLDGKQIAWFENGQKKSEGTFIDHKKDDKWTTWHENGQKESERIFRDDMKVSETKYTYYANGQIKSEINYKDGIKDGKWSWWYENGQFKSQGKFKNGRQDGKWTIWYKNGQIRSEGNFKDGKDDGNNIAWHENGQIQWERNYKDGIKDGKQIAWHQNGQIKSDKYYKDGVCIGGDCNLSISELDLLIKQLSSCWNLPPGALIKKNMMIKISAKVKADRKVVPQSVRIVDTNISITDAYYQPITESAIRTLLDPECNPLVLPENKYEIWNNLTITFDYNIMKN